MLKAACLLHCYTPVELCLRMLYAERLLQGAVWDAHWLYRLAVRLAAHLWRRPLICAWPLRRILPALLHFNGGQTLPNSCLTGFGIWCLSDVMQTSAALLEPERLL